MKRVGGAVGSVIAALIATWLTGFLSPLLPPPERAWLALKNHWWDIPPRPEEGFRIVLCWLKNDSNGPTRKKSRALFLAWRASS